MTTPEQMLCHVVQPLCKLIFIFVLILYQNTHSFYLLSQNFQNKKKHSIRLIPILQYEFNFTYRKFSKIFPIRPVELIKLENMEINENVK